MDSPSGHAYQKEIFLRMAAYRATHGGQLPPRNSLLWSEQARIRERRPLRFRLFERLRPESADPAWIRGRPLRAYLVERGFLSDDFNEADVEARLEAWPMVTAYRPEGRVFTGEWFTYTVEVRAESRRQAGRIVDFIFAVPGPRPAPESDEEAA